MIYLVIGALLFSISCSSTSTGYRWALEDLRRCADDQVFGYGDLCAEARDDEESPIDAHYSGVKCAAESIKACMGIE